MTDSERKEIYINKIIARLDGCSLFLIEKIYEMITNR